MTTTAISPARRRTRGIHPKTRDVSQSPRRKRDSLPEYLIKAEVDVMLKHAVHQDARLLMLIQWRAGLRVSEALSVRWVDVVFEDLGEDEHPTIIVRRGKGYRMRVVPLHPELRVALGTTFAYKRVKRDALILPVNRRTASRWIEKTATAARASGEFPEGRHVTTHTFRHSYARHLLAHNIPVNALSRWMGHSNLSSTLIYLELLPDPTGSIAQVP